MTIRIQLSQPTVKALEARLQQAYQKEDIRLVRSLTVFMDCVVHQVSVEALHERRHE